MYGQKGEKKINKRRGIFQVALMGRGRDGLGARNYTQAQESTLQQDATGI